MTGRRGAAACLSAALAVLSAGCRDEAAPAAPAASLDAAPARVADAIARAKALENAGDRPGAEAAWEEVLALRPGHASALYATARLRRRRGDLRGALERIGTLRAAEPNAGRGCLLAAEILADPASGPLRDLGRAAEAARAALGLNPEESGPHLCLGRVLLLRGEIAGAEERLAVAARMNPRDAESRSLLGVLCLGAGREGEARAWFHAALRGARPAGAAATHGGVPGEGDTAVSLDPSRPPSPGELRAVAGLGALGEGVGGTAEAGPATDALRVASEASLAARGTGEALLDLDGDGSPEGAAVRAPGGALFLAMARGGSTTLHRAP